VPRRSATKARPKHPKGQRSQARRREILEAAERAFGRSGYWGATLAEIAEEVGITQPALYRYFTSKRALFIEALALRQEDLEARVQGALAAPGSPLEKLERIARAATDLIFDHPEMAMLRVQATALGAQDDEVGRGVRETISRMLAGHQGLLEAAAAEGLLGANVAPATAASVIAGLAYLLYVTLTVGHPLASREEAHRAVDGWLALFAAADGPPGPRSTQPD